MKRCLLFSFIMLLVCSLYGYDVKTYLRQINTAELHITKGEPDAALQKYEEAFAGFEQPLGQDYYNAAVCAIKVHNKEKAFTYCYRLAAKAVGAQFFQKKAVFNELKQGREWASLLQKAENWRRDFRIKNAPFIAPLEALAATSNSTRQDYIQGKFNSNQGEGIRLYTNDTLAHALFALLVRDGYPDESRIGLNIIGDTILDPLPIFYTAMERRDRKIRTFADSALGAVFNAALARGQVKPEVWCRLVSFVNQYPYTEFIAFPFFSQYECTIYKRTDYDEQQLEQYREEKGLDPLKDYLQKLLFNKKESKNDFCINAYLVRQAYYFPDDKEKKQFMKRRRVVVARLPDCR